MYWTKSWNRLIFNILIIIFFYHLNIYKVLIKYTAVILLKLTNYLLIFSAACDIIKKNASEVDHVLYIFNT